MATSVALLARRRRKLVSHFMSRDAVSPEQAIGYAPDRFVDQRLFDRLRDRGVIKPAKPNLYYLDVPAYDDYASSRRKRVAIVLGSVLAVGGMLAALVR